MSLPSTPVTPAAAPTAPTVAEAAVDELARAGVQHVFGFPGETSLPLYVALQQRPEVDHVLARCPRCAGYMAEAYARISGRVGVCDAPGGIGSPWTTPALLEARNSSTPLVFLASGMARRKEDRWATGEVDQQALFGPVTKKTVRLAGPERTREEVAGALSAAATPRTGPVLLEFPADSLDQAVHGGPSPASASWGCAYPQVRAYPDPALVTAAADAVRNARQTVVVAGGGVHLSGAVEELRALSRETGLPVATTLNGKGAVDEDDARSLGVTGAKGLEVANRYVHEADCVIVLGSKLGDKSSDGYSWPEPHQTLVNVSDDAAELVRGARGGIVVQSDVRAFCEALRRELDGFRYPGPDVHRAEPRWDTGLTDTLCRMLTDALPEDGILVADASVSSGWAGAAVRLRGGTRRLLTPRGTGSLGYALPAAIGASVARPGARVVAIGGDGGLSMAMHEMETAARLGLPLVYFLLNNERLGLIDRHATDLLGGDPVSSSFTSVDWQSVAASFGWRSHRVTDTDALKSAWDEILAPADGPARPTLVECIVPATEMAPDFLLTLKRN
ncbi:thiamine pyrophosphate-binding protein [Streptomyces litmocidini]|uniref:Thiamine pyrophosphate-binding protein n=1 Tax=Streptomyces litmocidini TaxID=67318 RepID=A0ABW7UGI2_9ACTN|nr:thiamine pyrophosphate-binding protein [Streptomyces sp. PanSC19]ROQ35194.1 acetolactate synthase-1/2/3 large subunit [Streptomyces sp. PanSC19]